MSLKVGRGGGGRGTGAGRMKAMGSGAEMELYIHDVLVYLRGQFVVMMLTEWKSLLRNRVIEDKQR